MLYRLKCWECLYATATRDVDNIFRGEQFVLTTSFGSASSFLVSRNVVSLGLSCKVVFEFETVRGFLRDCGVFD